MMRLIFTLLALAVFATQAIAVPSIPLRPTASEFDARKVYNIIDYGATPDDDSDDDSAAIQAAVDAALGAGKVHIPYGDFHFNTTITVLGEEWSSGWGKRMPEITCEGVLIYDGVDTQPAVVIGEAASRFRDANIQLRVFNESQSDWTEEECVGVRIYNAYSSRFKMDQIWRFTVGLHLRGYGFGHAYNTYQLGSLVSNKWNIDGEPNATGWVNENLFIGGNLARQASVNNTSDAWCVRLGRDLDPIVYSDGNTFVKPSFEMLKEDTTGTMTAMQFIDARDNKVIDARSETNDVIINFNDNSNFNVIEYVDNFETGGTVVTAATTGNTVHQTSEDSVWGFYGDRLKLTYGRGGKAALANDNPGIELINLALDTGTRLYGLGIKFLSADAQFTTENPKLLAAIMPRATQAHDSDTTGGTALDFAVTENTPGATNVPDVVMSLDATSGMNVEGAITQYGVGNTATTTEIEDDTHAINTTGKYIGKRVYNTTTNLTVFASGTGATDHWYTSAGVDTHTPTP